MNLSVAPSSARRSKPRLKAYEATHKRLADEVADEVFVRMFLRFFKRELLPAGRAALQGRD